MQVLTFAFILAFIATVQSYPSYIAYDDYAKVPVHPLSGIWFNEEAPVRHKREPHRHRGGYGGGYGGGFDGYNQGFGGYPGYQQGFSPYQQAPIGQATSLAQSNAVANSNGGAGPGGFGSSTAIANANAVSTAGNYPGYNG